MPTTPAQNFANHRAVDRGLYGIALLVVAAAVVAMAAIFLWDSSAGPMLGMVAVLLQALVVLSIVLKLRRYALIVQDRVIRLEMLVRLERVLPKDLNERAKVLTMRQLIALRFAADRELPELVEKVLGDKITDGNAIKRMIQHWQADWQRV